jgi:hypothetical protein
MSTVVVVVTAIFGSVASVVIMFLIAVVVAGADELLVVVFAAEVVVHPLVVGEVEVRLRLVDDYLMAVIQVEVTITGGQIVGEDPTATALVNELVVGNIIISLDVGDVIVLCVVVARGAPGRLNADVDGKMDLCLRGIGNGETDQDGACQKEIFHTF